MPKSTTPYLSANLVVISHIPEGSRLKAIDSKYRRVYGRSLRGVNLETLEMQCVNEMKRKETENGTKNRRFQKQILLTE